jgi:oligoendopeptidase F
MAQNPPVRQLARNAANGHMAGVRHSIVNGEPMTGSASSLGELPEWDLKDLYESGQSEAFLRDLRRAEEEARRFALSYQGKLEAMAKEPQGGERLAQAIREYEALDELIGRLGSYAQLLYVEDTTDPARSKFFGDTSQHLNAIVTELLFFELELNRIEETVMKSLLQSPALGRYEPWIVDLRRERPYQLEERIERLFHEKSLTGFSAWNRLFDETIATQRFRVEDEELTLEPTLNLLLEAEEAKRRSAAEALAETFRSNLRLFTHITNTLAKDKEISNRWRGFKDIADSRHLSNRVEPEVVAALVAAVRESFPRLSHRYYALKAKWLGKEKLDHWDRNAPVPFEDTRSVPWQEARDTVLKAYSGFAPEMSRIAERFFDGRWIDAPVRPGKAPGAFAHSTVPSVHPYVLLNYQGKTRDVMTLAHELGHGVHQVLAAEQGPLLSRTPLTLAETASVFGEMLTFQSVLNQTVDAMKRKALLAQKVEDMLNTVVRQIAFYEFERKIHTERASGELTAERIGELWLGVQGESLGPAIRLGPGYETFWCYIPHFIHSPFYVYAYAFGDCLVNSLYARYREAEQGFVDKYFAMLKAGGSKHHRELLAPFGLDASDPSFWQRGLSMIEGFISEIEALDRR